MTHSLGTAVLKGRPMWDAEAHGSSAPSELQARSLGFRISTCTQCWLPETREAPGPEPHCHPHRLFPRQLPESLLGQLWKGHALQSRQSPERSQKGDPIPYFKTPPPAFWLTRSSTRVMVIAFRHARQVGDTVTFFWVGGYMNESITDGSPCLHPLSFLIHPSQCQRNHIKYAPCAISPTNMLHPQTETFNGSP